MAFSAETVVNTNFEILVRLIDSIIWPVTLLLILILFRRNLSEVILRLGTLKADSSGFEISFKKK